VEVADRLTGALTIVDHDPETGPIYALFLRKHADDLVNCQQQPAGVRVKVAYCRDVRARDNQEMHRGGRIDVPEGNYLVIGI
jgi:hypothetical protein